MSKEMLINVSEGEECRIALVEDGKLEELYMERTSSTSHVGNIYKGRVTNVEPSIQAAFIDFGLGRNGFLHISDLMPTYFGRQGNDIHETVGRKLARRDRPPIQRCLRRGDEIIVQIIKEGIGTKGPTLTTYLSIPGRILVMMPGMGKMGVSRKIEDDEERRRLRHILDSLKPPKDVGFIIRTAGVEKTKTEIQRDLTYLTRVWSSFVKKRDSGPGPMELYTEGDLVTRTVRDVFTTDIDRIVVDNKDVARRVKEVIKLANPRTKNRVDLHEDPVPLFHHYGIERSIEQIYSRHVPLPSGGSLVIDSTEAIVAIDVNSGKSREHADAETTAFRTDMEAADEIPRQLRLRDLGGVIICDFIDLRYERHRRELETRLHENFQKDRAKTKVLRMSQFGIIELTRQRMRPSLKRSIYFDCPHCKGAGLVKTPESMSLDVMRRLAIAINDAKVVRVELTVCPDVNFYLQNRKRGQIADLERQFGKRVVIRTDATIGLDETKIDLFDSRDALVYLEMLGMAVPTTPHTTQLGHRAPPPRIEQGRGRDGRRGQPPQRQGPPPRRPQRDAEEDAFDIDSVEDQVDQREEDLEEGAGEAENRQPDLDRARVEGPGENLAASDRSEDDGAGDEIVGEDSGAEDAAGEDHEGEDRGDDRAVAQDRPIQDRGARGPQDRGGQRDRGPQDRGPQDRGPQDRGPQDRGQQDRGRQDRPQFDRARQDRPQGGRPQDRGPQRDNFGNNQPARPGDDNGPGGRRRRRRGRRGRGGNRDRDNFDRGPQPQEQSVGGGGYIDEYDIGDDENGEADSRGPGDNAPRGENRRDDSRGGPGRVDSGRANSGRQDSRPNAPRGGDVRGADARGPASRGGQSRGRDERDNRAGNARDDRGGDASEDRSRDARGNRSADARDDGSRDVGDSRDSREEIESRGEDFGGGEAGADEIRSDEIRSDEIRSDESRLEESRGERGRDEIRAGVAEENALADAERSEEADVAAGEIGGEAVEAEADAAGEAPKPRARRRRGGRGRRKPAKDAAAKLPTAQEGAESEVSGAGEELDEASGPGNERPAAREIPSDEPQPEDAEGNRADAEAAGEENPRRRRRGGRGRRGRGRKEPAGEAGEASESTESNSAGGASAAPPRPARTGPAKSSPKSPVIDNLIGEKSNSIVQPPRVPLPVKDDAPRAAEAATLTRTGSADRHLVRDEPVAPQPIQRPRSFVDLDSIPDDFD
jgi:ribonuclease E